MFRSGSSPRVLSRSLFKNSRQTSAPRTEPAPLLIRQAQDRSTPAACNAYATTSSTSSYLKETRRWQSRAALAEKEEEEVSPARPIQPQGASAAAAAAVAKKVSRDEFIQQQQNTPVTLTASAFALKHRLGLQDALSDALFMQALTHKSFEHGWIATNERLAYLGDRVLQFYATEYVHMKYPRLPLATVEQLVQECVGDVTVGNVARGVGITQVMRWKPAIPQGFTKKPGEHNISAKCLQSIVGALFQEHGAAKARTFVHTFFLQKALRPEDALLIERPKTTLVALMRRKGMERPISRLLKESGRASKEPIFVVGVYSANLKIGEGFGKSLQIAENRAARDALMKYFMHERPVEMEDLPSQFEDDTLTFFAKGEVQDTPPIV